MPAKKLLTLTILGVLLTTSLIALAQVTGKPSNTTITTTATEQTWKRFIVPLDNNLLSSIADKAVLKGFIMEQNKQIFIEEFAKKNPLPVCPQCRQALSVNPGGYKIPNGTTSTAFVDILSTKPYMKWVKIKPGLRKEEIADILATELGWSNAVKRRWINVYTALKYDYREGTYFPDTYLIPVDEKPQKVAERMIAKFNEQFAPYLPEFTAKNIPWTRGLTLASLVQREAASVDEMPLIAGILYNRIDQKMSLGIDATIQYIRGNKGAGYWAPLTKEDLKLKTSDSKYNTYKLKGLPPRPIANPGIAAIEAVLNPTKTDCLYYLHDKNRTIYCAATYEEHLQNIQKYLKTSDTTKAP